VRAWKYLFFFSLLSITVAAANDDTTSYKTFLDLVQPDESERTTKFVASGRFGWDWAKVGNSQYIKFVNIQPAPSYFDTEQSTNERFLLGGFLGVEFPFLIKRLHWQTGAAYYQTNNFKTKGIIYDWSLPDEGNREYHYQIKNQRVMFENKFLYRLTKYFYGYILGGVGAAFNKSQGYYEVALNQNTTPGGVFEPHTETSVSYSVGIGAEAILTDYLRAGVGYQFSDLGKTKFGDYSTGNTNETISTAATPTQELILQMSFIF